MKFWNERTNQEKVMLIAIVVLLISIALSWKRISQGIQKGVNPYLKEMPAH